MTSNAEKKTPQELERYAGIDIGSNAVRLIIKDLLPAENNKFTLKKRVYIRLPLRLGLDVFSVGKIMKEKQDEFLKAMQIFKDVTDYYRVNEYRACATSAMRNAKNNKIITDQIKEKTDINIEIIDGHEEAELLYLTNREKLEKGQYYISADLGGGSLQIGLFKYTELIWAHAYKTGTLRFITKTVEQKEIISLEKKLENLKKEYPDAKLTGSGGNINKISKLINKNILTYQDLENLYKNLIELSYSERIKKYAFREDRADVILPALKIYMRLMKATGKNTIFVPKTGLADGIIHDLFLKDYEINKLKHF